jgi:hypothetical protein
LEPHLPDNSERLPIAVKCERLASADLRSWLLIIAMNYGEHCIAVLVGIALNVLCRMAPASVLCDVTVNVGRGSDRHCICAKCDIGVCEHEQCCCEEA